MYTKDQVLELIDLAWAVGLFEGEGWITTANCDGGRMKRQMGLNMTDEDVMRRFVKVVGPTSKNKDLYGPYHPASAAAHHKDSWQWNQQRKSEVKRVLQLLLPLLGERRTARALEMLKELDEATN